jgi:hypothetical protein
MGPFDFWIQAWRGGAIYMETATKMAETLQASHSVIDTRTRMMRDASSNPLSADYRELNRMVPEKIAAFSKSGMAISGDIDAMYQLAAANMTQAANIMTSGRVPNPSEMAQMSSRSVAMMATGMNATGKALAPIHSTATGNARRLSRKR